MCSLPWGRHWASPRSSDPSPSADPFPHGSLGDTPSARVLVTHLPKTGGLGGGYLEMEEGSVGCQCR